MVSGIICEFNPLHNGHKYLIDSAKSDRGYVICVMSGNFVQRGEVSLYDKYTRTKAALICGADLVIELPAGWSMSGAENFAFGGISLLKSTGIVDKVVFGAEDNNKDLLLKTAQTLISGKIDNSLLSYMSDGTPYASARERALENFVPECADILSKPNNILAVEYIKASIKMNYEVEFCPVKRIGAEHDSKVSSDNFSSASNIRKLILENKINDAGKYIPEEAFDVFKSSPIAREENIDNAIMFMLRTLSLEQIKALPEISEGIENRIFSQIKVSRSLEELIMNVKSKRYTYSRIRRILMCAAFGIDNSYIKKQPPYIRVLGYNDSGLEMLKEIANKSSVPLVVSSKDIKKLDGFAKQVFNCQSLTSDLYGLAFDCPLPCSSEFTSPIIKI